MQHILATKFNNYIRPQRFHDGFREVFGKALLGLNHAHTPDNGDMWRLQRKVAAKVFSTGNFKIFTEEIFQKYVEKTIDVIKEHDGKFDMAVVGATYALQSIFDIVCGIPLVEVDDTLGQSFAKSAHYVDETITNRIYVKPHFKYFGWCMPSEYKMKREVKVLTDMADGILARRLKESDDEIAPRSDIMSLFIKKARELEGGEGASILDVETLRSIFLMYIATGADTTSAALTYLFYVLALYPEVQQKVYEELAAEANKESLVFDDLKKLKYLDAVVNETIRLYPTVAVNFKEAAEDDYLPDGTFVPAGTHVVYSAWYMGRHNPIFGEDRHLFRPERWLEMKTRPTAFEFPVFQGGPRTCPGMNMAAVEMKLFAAKVVRQFHVKIQEGEKLHDRKYIVRVSLVMEGGLPLQLTPREAATAY